MAWEVFTGARLQSDRISVSISASGRLHMTKKAANLFTAKHIQFVEILFNSETNEVALRGVADRGTGNYDLRLSTTGASGAGFSCISFLNHIGYDWTESRTFDAQWSTTSNWLTFSIPAGHLGHPPIKRSRLKKERMHEKEAAKATS